MERIAVVIPVLNESQILPVSLPKIAQVLALAQCEPRLIPVDDGSTDNSRVVLAKLAEQDPRITPLAFTRNFGKEAAILAGLDQALTDPEVQAVLVMDADLQHPPDLIPQLITHWRAGHRVVEGVRDGRQGEGPIKRLGASVFYAAMSRYCGLDLDRVTDFKLIDRSVAAQILALGERGRFFRGLVHWLGYQSFAVQFTVPDRAVGASRWGIGGLARYAWRNLTSFSAAPLQLVTLLGGIGLLVGLVLAVKAIVDKVSGVALDGFSTVILLSIIFSSLILLALGIIGSYLARIYEEIKARPAYVLRDSLQDTPPRKPSA